MILGLRTAIYPVPDLAAGKAFYSAVLGVEPYFDEPGSAGIPLIAALQVKKPPG